MIALGVDPGKTGAAAIVGPEGPIEWVEFAKSTDHDIAAWFEDHGTRAKVAFLERVHSSPQMGVRSAFTFGDSFGFLRGMLVAFSIPFETVTPAQWQRSMSCRSGGDKNVTKAAAQRLFPMVPKITHAIADALLIAEYARRFAKDVV